MLNWGFGEKKSRFRTIPKWGPCFETGIPHLVMGRRQKKSKTGSPHSKKESKLKRGVTCTLMPLTSTYAHVLSKKEDRLPNSCKS